MPSSSSALRRTTSGVDAGRDERPNPRVKVLVKIRAHAIGPSSPRMLLFSTYGSANFFIIVLSSLACSIIAIMLSMVPPLNPPLNARGRYLICRGDAVGF